MATLSELETKVDDLTKALSNPKITDASLKQRLQQELDKTRNEIAALQGGQQPTSSAPSTQTPNLSNIPSTDSSTWNGTFNVGDLVRVRIDYVSNIYATERNVGKIINIVRGGATPFREVNGNNVGGLQRPENPSGLLYEVEFESGRRNIESWEGKDLELAYTQTQSQNPTQQPMAQPIAQQPQGSSAFLNAMMSTVQAMMSSSSGSGADSPAVRQIIKDYLRDEKVNLSELDKSVLEEIKKNQLQILEIPQFSMKLEVNNAVSKIPNFYEIIDDILAGNNVY
jgi:ElaB/YqjD/DUF883 family membrane-anchored ribosome-binding protein